MADTPEIAFQYPSGGMNGSGVSSRVPPAQTRRQTNVQLVDEIPTTRPRVIVHDLPGDIAGLNIQGAKYFNPAKGQDALSNSSGGPQILIAAGGRKFTLSVSGEGIQTELAVTEITNGLKSNPAFHLAWWETAENYAFCGDGNGDTFIWDSANPAFVSPGYDSVDKPSSKVPNGGTCMLYAHGRLVVVVNSRAILVGDAIHKSSLTSAKNLLDFTEQVYWDTGQMFIPPSSMGNILALEILPVLDTAQGQGEILAHCEDGIFSVDINIAPRSDWSSKSLVRHALLEAGAVGPYAVALRVGDQIYRTRHGICTFRSARAQANVEGDPMAPMSEPVNTFLKSDVPDWLRFCSINTWAIQNRLLCTVDPTMDGRYRWHNAVLVRNFAPRPLENSAACWEGIWTLPAECCGVVQLINGMFWGKERQFALCIGQDGKNRLVEFTGELGDDVLSDGTRQPVRSQIITRAVDYQTPMNDKGFLHGTLFLRNVIGAFEWAVWVRRNGKTGFTFWRAGAINVSDSTGPERLEQAEPFTGDIPLGNFPKDCSTKQGVAFYYEVLIRWKGVGQIESFRMQANGDDVSAEKMDAAKFAIMVTDPLAGDYRDYEYSSEQTWTLKGLN